MGKKILIVGLGNPGREYEKTRHNAGYMAVDFFANKKMLEFNNKYDGLFAKTKINGNDIYVLKPTTYMNLSGKAVIQVVNFFKINVKDIVVIHDDLDIGIGELRFKTKGSSAGHNGLKDIIRVLGTQEFKRVKIGIGKPEEMTTVDFVLGKFSRQERSAIDEAILEVYKFLDLYTQSNEENSFDKVISKLSNDNR